MGKMTRGIKLERLNDIHLPGISLPFKYPPVDSSQKQMEKFLSNQDRMQNDGFDFA